MLAFLQAHARTGIPQNVEYLINDVGGKHGHIHLGKAQMYMQVDTPLLLKELQARKEIKPFFVRHFERDRRRAERGRSRQTAARTA